MTGVREPADPVQFDAGAGNLQGLGDNLEDICEGNIARG